MVAVEADIAVVKRSNETNAVPGEMFSYTITVTNLGPNAAENVLLTDIIPGSILNPQFSQNGGSTFQPWTGSLNLGTLAPGEIVTIIIRGTVREEATGVITNTATVSSPTPDPNPANNTSTVTTPVRSVVGKADISVIKLSNKRKACVGELLEFTIIVSNAGPADAENVTLIDNVANILKSAVFSLDKGETWDLWNGRLSIGILLAGNIRIILLRGIIKQTCDFNIINVADVISTTPDSNFNNNTSTVFIEVKQCCCDNNRCCYKDRRRCCNDKRGCCNDKRGYCDDTEDYCDDKEQYCDDNRRYYEDEEFYSDDF